MAHVVNKGVKDNINYSTIDDIISTFQTQHYPSPIIHIRLSIGLGNGAMCHVLNEHVIPKHVIRTTC